MRLKEYLKESIVKVKLTKVQDDEMDMAYETFREDHDMDLINKTLTGTPKAFKELIRAIRDDYDESGGLEVKKSTQNSMLKLADKLTKQVGRI